MSNNFYNDTGTPGTGGVLSSAAMRGELALIEAGFDKLPTITGNALKTIRVNSGATALEAVAVTGTGNSVYSASPTFSGTPVFGGSAVTWSGNPTHSGTHTFSGAMTFSSTVTVTGAATLSSTLAVTGAATFSSTVAGAFNGTIGATTPAAGTFTTIGASGALTLTNAQNLQWDNSNNAIGVSGTTMTFTVNSGNRATLDSTALTLLSGVDLRIPTQTPASASATGTVGTIAWDGSFLYVATGSDTWKRVAIATW